MSLLLLLLLPTDGNLSKTKWLLHSQRRMLKTSLRNCREIIDQKCSMRQKRELNEEYPMNLVPGDNFEFSKQCPYKY